MPTFFADSAGTQGTGTGVSEANACTLIEAITNDAVLHTALVADSIINVANGTEITYAGDSTVFAATAVAGTRVGPIIVRGFASTVGDEGIVQIRDTDSGTTNDCFDVNHDYWHFENFQITNSRQAFDQNGPQGCLYKNIRVIDSLFDGFAITGSNGDGTVLIQCYVSGNAGGQGILNDSRYPLLINCVVVDAVGDGFVLGNAAGSTQCINCYAHACGDDGFVMTGESRFVNCVANRNTGDGFHFADTNAPHVMINCGATSNGGYGVNATTTGTQVRAVNCGLNPTNETNTSGASHANVDLLASGAIAGDPDFADSNPATDINVDLGISASSAWLGTALGFQPSVTTGNSDDVGVSRRATAGGGGGLKPQPSMTGGMPG